MSHNVEMSVFNFFKSETNKTRIASQLGVLTLAIAVSLMSDATANERSDEMAACSQDRLDRLAAFFACGGDTSVLACRHLNTAAVTPPTEAQAILNHARIQVTGNDALRDHGFSNALYTIGFGALDWVTGRLSALGVGAVTGFSGPFVVLKWVMGTVSTSAGYYFASTSSTACDSRVEKSAPTNEECGFVPNVVSKETLDFLALSSNQRKNIFQLSGGQKLCEHYSKMYEHVFSPPRVENLTCGPGKLSFIVTHENEKPVQVAIDYTSQKILRMHALNEDLKLRIYSFNDRNLWSSLTFCTHSSSGSHAETCESPISISQDPHVPSQVAPAVLSELSFLKLILREAIDCCANPNRCSTTFSAQR